MMSDQPSVLDKHSSFDPKSIAYISLVCGHFQEWTGVYSCELASLERIEANKSELTVLPMMASALCSPVSAVIRCAPCLSSQNPPSNPALRSPGHPGLPSLHPADVEAAYQHRRRTASPSQHWASHCCCRLRPPPQSAGFSRAVQFHALQAIPA